MKKILINKDPWQTRIAITKNNVLENIYFSAHAAKTLERSFFKGTVATVLPGIQTVFVDIGQEKAGFLHISEIDRELAIKKFSDINSVDEQDGQKEHQVSLRKALDVAKIFKTGDPVLVQVSKEPVYEKGAKLTTCFTLPGRFIVLLPNIPRVGVSKKIEDRKERTRLKDVIKEQLPEGMGAIIRTTAEGTDDKELCKDIKYLIDTWNIIQKRFADAKSTEKIYEDLELSLQIVRDHLDEDVEAIITDNKDNQHEIYKFIKTVAPEFTHKVSLFSEPVNIFEYYDIQDQLEKALHKKVPLKSGGSLIIESTEAMTVIDVNTGSFTGKGSMEETILKTNLEAAEECVRQLRLRNIGGLIVIDFIDMAEVENRHRLFNFFDQRLKERDKFQSVVLKISEFGLVQMTRKRSGKTLVQTLTNTCPTCMGLGFIKSVGTEAYTILRKLRVALNSKTYGPDVHLLVSPAVFEHITTLEYNAILELEKTYDCKITIIRKDNMSNDQYKIEKK
jgi:ribonuclease G